MHTSNFIPVIVNDNDIVNNEIVNVKILNVDGKKVYGEIIN